MKHKMFRSFILTLLLLPLANSCDPEECRIGTAVGVGTCAAGAVLGWFTLGVSFAAAAGACGSLGTYAHVGACDLCKPSPTPTPSKHCPLTTNDPELSWFYNGICFIQKKLNIQEISDGQDGLDENDKDIILRQGKLISLQQTTIGLLDQLITTTETLGNKIDSQTITLYGQDFEHVRNVRSKFKLLTRGTSGLIANDRRAKVFRETALRHSTGSEDTINNIFLMLSGGHPLRKKSIYETPGGKKYCKPEIHKYFVDVLVEALTMHATALAMEGDTLSPELTKKFKEGIVKATSTYNRHCDCSTGYRKANDICVDKERNKGGIVPENVIDLGTKLPVNTPIRSPNGEFSCAIQSNGNFAITNSDGVVLWSTNTVGVGLYLEFRVDGTLGIYDQFGVSYWSAGTFGKGARRLVLENTGFLVLYSVTGEVLWTTQHHKLFRGQALKTGYSMGSSNGVYTLTMQDSGHLVLSSTHGSETWYIGTSGLGAGSYLQFDSDGNLVLYGEDGEDYVAKWDSGTTGSKAKALILQDDGQLVLCCNKDGGLVWSGVGNFIREGSYECLEKSGSYYVEIKRWVVGRGSSIADSSVREIYKWTNEAREVWTLYPTDEINVLRVGEDSPHYASANHRTAVFNAAGVSGPSRTFCVFRGGKAGCPVAQLDVSTANAIDNNLIGRVTVTLSQDGEVVEQLTTDTSGKGKFNSPHGQVILTAEHDGFTMAPVHITVGAEECEKVVKLSLSPEYAGAARVVVNWGILPKDLDLHVKQYKDGKVVCHGFYNNKNCGGFKLDVDNRDGGLNGAETVTFSQLEAGSEYMVFVYEYTMKDAPTYLPQSQARVAFYRDGYAPTQMSVPTQGNDSSRRWWMVACFNSFGQLVGSNRNELMSSEPTECYASERSRDP